MKSCGALRWGAFLVLVALAAMSCSGADRTSTEFCEKLAEVTGSSGVESALVPGDPARIDGIVSELAELHDRAPEEISATTRALVNFFRSYQRAPRTDRRALLSENQAVLSEASANLDAYALDECGLLLQRTAPTPGPTVNPALEAPDE